MLFRMMYQTSKYVQRMSKCNIPKQFGFFSDSMYIQGVPKKTAQLSAFVVHYPLGILTYREHHFKAHITEFLFTVFSVSAKCRLDGRMQTYKFMKKCGFFFALYQGVQKVRRLNFLQEYKSSQKGAVFLLVCRNSQCTLLQIFIDADSTILLQTADE